MRETSATEKTKKKASFKILTDRWYIFPVVVFLLAVIVFYAVIGENSYIAVADNMDLFVPQYRMLGMRDIYFAHGAAAPFLDGISRDVLPSEFNLVSFLYMIFPPFAAYVASYVCKVLLAVISFYLLGQELLAYEHVFSRQSVNRTISSPSASTLVDDALTAAGDGLASITTDGSASAATDAEGRNVSSRTSYMASFSADRYTRSKKAVVTLAGLSYGMLTLFPNFGIAFSAVPLILYLFLKLDRIVSGKKIARRIVSAQERAIAKNRANLQKISNARNSENGQDEVKTKDSAGIQKHSIAQHGIGRKARKTKLYRRRVAFVYLAIFLYPLVSYFSYFGIFILAYVLVAFIIFSIRRKSLQGHLFRGFILLAAGYVVFEYRLFNMMLFGTQETIRSTMQMANADVRGIFTTAFSALTTPYMHEADVHQFFVLPICVMYFIYTNIRHIDTGRVKDIFRDLFNLCVLLVLINCLMAGLYAYAPFRNLIATLLPPLTGFQFDRTTFFNPFLWYAMLAIICVRLVTIRIDEQKSGRVGKSVRAYAYANRRKDKEAPVQGGGFVTKEICKAGEETDNELEFLDLSDHRGNRLLKKGIACFLLAISMLIILLTPTTYNDLRATLAGEVHLRKDGHRIDAMNWKEFYSEDLFTQIKEDIGYRDEWCVAYGMYPAVLEYNGICTLDGYLGFYSQAYKEEFRKIIAPALDRVEQNRLYYDNWGARCYLSFGTDTTVAMGTKSLYGLTDTDLYIDAQALKNLYGKYLFSRVKISNADETGLTLLKAYEEDTQAYPVYVYAVN